MEHQIYKEWIALAVDSELTSHEQAEFERHINDCLECRVEFEEQKKLKSFLLENNPGEPGEYFLFEARQGLRNSIRAERAKDSGWKKIINRFSFLSSKNLQFAFGGLGILLVGFIAGYLIFNQSAMPDKYISSGDETGNAVTVGSSMDQFSLAQDDIRITNIRFIDQDASDGEVEFVFEAVKPVRMKGNINDERIKNVLTYSMLNVENPGVRLNTINAIGADQKEKFDPEVKAAVISVAKFDENPGVRREAIKLLSKLSYDQEIKNSLLYVLMNDSVSGNRIEAINTLMLEQKEGKKFSEDELSIFKEKMKRDDNNYIRFKAKTVLEESK